MLVCHLKMAAPMEANVDLGFVESCDEKWKLLSHFFPSKVGGKPAWLALKNVPCYGDIKCQHCQKPCVFLMQVYAPFTELDSCFHRTIFIFICRDYKCGKDNIIVLRSQVERSNQFYSCDPPDESNFSKDEDFPKADNFQPLCHVCGCAGPKRCSKCQKTTYCGKEHQTVDWKRGHKTSCGQDVAGVSLHTTSSNQVLFPEYDLVTEAEVYTDEDQEKTEAEKLKEYQEYMNLAKKKGTLLEDKQTTNDLEQMATGDDKVDKQFGRFKKRTKDNPEQVLRYERNGNPLWVSTEGQPKEEDIPDCPCGAKRQFEFQVMPQLLNHLDVDRLGDSLDWGTLAVYTCADSCISPTAYHKEFVWKQDFAVDKS